MKPIILLRQVIISVFLIVCCQYQAFSQSYEKLKINTSTGNHKSVFEYLKSLPTDSLYTIAELSAIENNESILSYVEVELTQRIKNKTDLSNFSNQLRRKNLNQKYLNTLFKLLNSTYRNYDANHLNNIFDITSQYFKTVFDLKYSDQLLENRLLILETNNVILSHLNGYNQINRYTVKNYCNMLQKIMLDNNENHEIRREAIKGIQYNNYKEAASSLLTLISDKSIINNPLLSKPLCLALSYFKEKLAFQHINYILENTSNESVYASAAIALGDLGGEPSLKTLVRNIDKFDSKYNEVAIRKLKNEIFSILSNNDDGNEMLPYAIKATEYLYKEEEIIQYKALLKKLLYNTKNKTLIRIILNRFEQIITKEEAGEIINKILNDAAYSKEWNYLNNLSNSNTITIQESDIPVFEKDHFLEDLKGELNYQEYGDAAYQDNSFAILWGGIEF
jgi:hypothetical protein